MVKTMEYGKIEYEKMLFLKEYGFEIYNDSNGRYEEIYCVRQDCCIVYHRWSQFGDFNVIITENVDKYKNYVFDRVYGINWIIKNVVPRYTEINGKNRWEYIDLVVFYLKDKIANKEEAFGIIINNL